MVDAGSSNGIQAGQQYYIRRTVINRYDNALGRRTPARHRPDGSDHRGDREHRRSDASTLPRDGIEAGDYLEPYAAPTLPWCRTRRRSRR